MVHEGRVCGTSSAKWQQWYSGNISTAPAGTENTYGNTKHLREQKTPKRERKHLGNKKHQSGNRKPAALTVLVFCLCVDPASRRLRSLQVWGDLCSQIWAFARYVPALYKIFDEILAVAGMLVRSMAMGYGHGAEGW